MQRKVIIIGALVITILWIVTNTFYKRLQDLDNKILPNIYIDSINVGYLTQEQAYTLLNKFYKPKSAFTTTFEFENKPISTLEAAEINYRLPIKEVVEQAYLVGRGPKLVSRITQIISLSLGWEEYKFTLQPQYNKEAVQKHLKQLNEAYRVKPQDAKFEFVNGRVTAFQVDKVCFALDTQAALSHFEQQLNKVKKTDIKNITIKILF